MTNFADFEEIEEVAMESQTIGIPEGAIDWVYSDWNFYNPLKPVKLSVEYWIFFFLKICKIVLDGYKFYGGLDSNYTYYNFGRYLVKPIIGVMLFINAVTDWHIIDGMKPWVRYAGHIPKPANYEQLKYRPVSWAKSKKAKGGKDLKKDLKEKHMLI